MGEWVLQAGVHDLHRRSNVEIQGRTRMKAKHHTLAANIINKCGAALNLREIILAIIPEFTVRTTIRNHHIVPASIPFAALGLKP